MTTDGHMQQRGQQPECSTQSESAWHVLDVVLGCAATDEQPATIIASPIARTKRARRIAAWCLSSRTDESVQRLSTPTNVRVFEPRYTWRGLAIFCSLSPSISSHWQSQPGARPIAKSTVIMSSGTPIAW